MPAVSKSQRRFMATCKHNPAHAHGKCPDMSKSDMSKFASTPEKGLPEKKRPKYAETKRQRGKGGK